MPRVTSLIAACAVFALAHSHAAIAQDKPDGEEALPVICTDQLERAGFRNRYAFVGAMTRMSACNVKGLLPDEVMRSAVAPRARQVIEACYTEEEKGFIGSVIKRGVLQSLPHIQSETCAEVLAQFETIPMPE